MAISDFWKRKDIRASRGVLAKAKTFLSGKVTKLKDTVKDKSMNALAWKNTGAPELGKMYFYAYDPKHKKTLPFYDRLPLIIPIEFYDDGWLGMNLHYLPPTLRFKFLQELMRISSNPKLNDNTKLVVSYKLLKAAAKSKYFKPTIKRYLTKHVRSNIMQIHPKDWESIIFLPSAKWTKGKPY